MESSQTRVEEVASDNILQPPKPPKRKKKKVSFAVWLEQYAPEELKTSAENIKQQDASVVIENESIAKAQETVDQKGDRPTPESESNEKNQVPFKTWSEEHVPVDQAISAGNIEKQNNSLVSEEESTTGVQETIDIAEKEQPSKSKEQPQRTRRNRKKMIPFNIWLEKHAPADLKISAESTGMEDVSLVTKQESIPVLQEIPEKEQPSKSGAENVIKQDTSLPKEEGDQEDSLKKETCEEEPVISTTQLVGEKKSISKSQETVDQKEDRPTPESESNEKNQVPFKTWSEEHVPVDQAISGGNIEQQNNSLVSEEESTAGVRETIDIAEKEQPSKSKEQPPRTRRNRKKMIPFHIWLEKNAPADLKISAESTGLEDVSLDTKQESIPVLQEIPEKEQPSKSGAENVIKQDTSLPKEEGDQEDSLKKETCEEEPVISTTQLVGEKKSISKSQETVDQKEDRPTPERESNEKNQVPFKTWSEEHVPVDQAISGGNIEQQNNSLVSEEESTAGVQETIDIAEKEQPSKSKEQPPRTRRNRKKMIPFHIWLEKHAPADLKISAESTGLEDVSLDTKQESIPVLQEIREKEQPSKSGAENVIKQDTSLPKEEGDQEDSLKKETCEEEPVISTTQLVGEKKSISKSQETVDQKEDRPTPERESNEKNQVPFKTWSEEHVPVDQAISGGNIEQQNNSLVSEEESTTGVQETIDIAEKEQPSKSKEQPPRTRRNRKKMIPFHIWLEKNAPADLKISAESTGLEDVSLDTKQESIPVLQEIREKEQPSKSGAENVIKQDTSLPKEEGDQEDSLKKETCEEEPVISTTQLVGEKKSISKSQKIVDQKEEEQTSKTKRIKRTPLLWKSFPESDACIDLAFFTENNDISNGPLPEKQNDQAALPSTGNKTFWKMLPKSERRIDVSFFAENIEKQNVSITAPEHDEAASLKKESYSKKTVISMKQIATKKESIFKPQETLDQKGEKYPSTVKPKDNIQTESLTKVLNNLTAENVQLECLPEIQNLPHSSENTSQAKCKCLVKSKESELEYIEVQKYLMKQLEEMFNINQKLNAKLKQQKDLMRKRLSERKQSNNSMVSVQTQTDYQDSPKQKTASYQSASIQTEMDVQENSYQLKPVRCTISTQTEMDVLETRCQYKPDYQTISTQTELFLLLRKQPSETRMNGNQDRQTKLFKRFTGENRRESPMKAASEQEALGNEKVSGANSEKQDISVPEVIGDQTATSKNDIHANEIGKPQEAIKEETVSKMQQNGDHQHEKKPSKKSNRKNKRKSTMRAASELETLNNDKVSGENNEQLEVSIPETVEDQTGTIKNEIRTKKTVIAKVQQITEKEMVSETQQNGNQQDEKKPSKKSNHKNKRKSAMRAASDLKAISNENISGEKSEQEVSIPEIVGDQTATIVIEIHRNETVAGKPQQIIEEESVSTAQINFDQQDEKKPSKKSNRKNKRKAAIKAASEPETLNTNKVSGESSEQLEVSIPGTVGDRKALIKNEIHMIETVIGKLEQAIEEATVSETQQNGEHHDEKKPIKKSKSKNKRKAAVRAASELETLNEENISGKNIEQEVSIAETVGDQTATIINDIDMIETVISSPQQISEELIISKTQQNGDNEVKKRSSKKSKRKNKRKLAMKADSELKAVSNENISGENTEQVSIQEIVGDQTATIITEIYRNETVIGKQQQATEDETVPETQQILDQPDEKVELETIINPTETVQNIKTPKIDFEIIPEIPQTAFEQIQTKPCKVSEDVTGKVPIVSTEGESGLMKKQRTSNPQIKVTVKEDVIQTTSQELDTQVAEESAEQNDIAEQEESPRKKISLWKRLKKALSPTSLRKFKDRCKVHPA